MENRKMAYLYLTITVCAWGSMYVVSKYIFGKAPVFTILLLRYLIGGAILLLISKKRAPEKIAREDYKYLFLIGFFGYTVSTGAQFLGNKLSNASLASLINSMNPVVIIFFAGLILREKITVKKVVAVLAAMGGTYTIIGGAQGGGQLIGILLSFFAMITWALMSVITRRITQKYNAFIVTTYSIVIAMFCTLPVSIYELATTPQVQLFDRGFIFSILYMGLVCTAIALVLWNKSLSMIEAGICSLFYPLQLMTSVLLGGLFLGETINARFILGAVLIIGGVLFSTLGKEKRASS